MPLSIGLVPKDAKGHSKSTGDKYSVSIMINDKHMYRMERLSQEKHEREYKCIFNINPKYETFIFTVISL